MGSCGSYGVELQGLLRGDSLRSSTPSPPTPPLASNTPNRQKGPAKAITQVDLGRDTSQGVKMRWRAISGQLRPIPTAPLPTISPFARIHTVQKASIPRSGIASPNPVSNFGQARSPLPVPNAGKMRPGVTLTNWPSQESHAKCQLVRKVKFCRAERAGVRSPPESRHRPPNPPRPPAAPPAPPHPPTDPPRPSHRLRVRRWCHLVLACPGRAVQRSEREPGEGPYSRA